MNINDSVLQNNEKVIFSLRELYQSSGYSQYRMSKFEEYDLYAKHKGFLVDDNVITFTDTSGKLMALKPDVTMSIINNFDDKSNNILKVFYDENVYRVSKGTNSYKEILQAGVECVGNITTKEVSEVITLACKSLNKLSNNYVLLLSDVSLIKYLVDNIDLSRDEKKNLYKAISEKNIPEIDLLTKECSNKYCEAIKSLLLINDNLASSKESIESILKDFDKSTYEELLNVLSILSDSEISGNIKVDFSCIDNTNYYNNIVFKGYIMGIPLEVLSGGQYDEMMQRLKKDSKAIGFAVYTDALERLDEEKASNDSEYINVALPKGRLGEKVYNYFSKAGFPCPSILEENRKLIFENEEKKVRYFWVKPSDVAIYVERGAADIGVAGKDILLEYNPDVYELLDLDLGKCDMCVAAPKTFNDDKNKTLVVATKFSNIAKKYYSTLGRDIDIIHLNGSIEIAPILGLSDVIVDIVETGTTLKENDLVVVEKFLPISARLIANKTSMNFKNETITKIQNALTKIIEEK